LRIERVPFEHMDGNCQGYARERSVAVSPVVENPLKTMLHELAHVVLGHTEASECADSGELTRAERSRGRRLRLRVRKRARDRRA